MKIKDVIHEFKTQTHRFENHRIYDPKEYNQVFLSNEAYNQINLMLTTALARERWEQSDANDAAISRDYPHTDREGGVMKELTLTADGGWRR